MRKANVVAVAAVASGVCLALLDFASGPSLNLLAVNSTVISALTIASLALLAASSTKPAWEETQERIHGTRRTPLDEMVELLKGAADGYTLNRKEIALVLRSAVEAKLGNETGSPPREAVDAYLRNTLGVQRFSEFFSESEWRTTKVEGSRNYPTHLRDVVTSLRQSLGF